MKPLEFADGDRRIGIYPADEFSVQCFVDYHHPAAGPQKLELTVSRDSFSRDLAPARTFTFVKELEALRKMGLIRGGSLANAIVMDDQCILNGPLRFADEFVRHKALDLIGDMALVGRPLLGRIVRTRPATPCIRSWSRGFSPTTRSGRKPPRNTPPPLTTSANPVPASSLSEPKRIEALYA